MMRLSGTHKGRAGTDLTGTDGWRIFGETGSLTPRLEITYIPEPTTLTLLTLPLALLSKRRRQPPAPPGVPRR